MYPRTRERQQEETRWSEDGKCVGLQTFRLAKRVQAGGNANRLQLHLLSGALSLTGRSFGTPVDAQQFSGSFPGVP